MKQEKAKAALPGRLADQDYDAFISYSHGDADNAAAAAVQRMLEEFRLPKAFGKKEPGGQKHPFQRVFLDRGEMSSCADFQKELEEVLMKTPWLIVICSPRSAGSVWVSWEIETFLKHHQRSHILGIMIEGGPDSAFPAQLRRQEGAHGEALAADARGRTAAQVRRRLRRDALLQIAAPMLHTTYDALKQRHRLYRLQRMAAAGLGVLCCAVAFSVYAVTQNLRLQRQYDATRAGQSRLLALDAQERLQANDAAGAIRLALQGLPGDGETGPAVPEAEYVLSRALQVYTTENQLSDEAFSTRVFVRDNQYSGGFFGADGILFARDMQNIYLWDAGTGELNKKIPVNSVGRQKLSADFMVQDARQLIYTDGLDAVCYDYGSGAEVWRVTGADGFTNCCALYLPARDQVTVIWYSSLHGTLAISLLNRADGRVICQDKVELGEQKLNDSVLEVSEGEGLIAFFVDPPYDQPQDSGVLVYDLDERQARIIPLQDGTGRTLLFIGDQALAVGMWEKNESWLEGEDYPGRPWIYKIQSMARLVCGRVDLETGQWAWQKTFSSGTCDAMRVLARTVGEKPCVLFWMGNQYRRLDARDGSVLEEMDMESPLRALFATKGGVSVLTENGRMYRMKYDYPLWTNASYCGSGVFEAAFDGADTVYVSYTEDGWIGQPEIYRYQEKTGDPNFVQVYALEEGEVVRSSYVGEGVCASILKGREKTVVVYRWQGETRQVDFPPDWEDYMELSEISGSCLLEGRPALLILGEDPESYQVCAAAVTLEDGAVHRLELQLMDPWMFSGRSLLEDGTLYCVDAVAENRSAQAVWAWTPGTPVPEQAVLLPEKNAAGEKMYFSQMTPSPDGAHWLVSGVKWLLDSQQEEDPPVLCLLERQQGQLKLEKLVELPAEAGEILGWAWNQESTRFAFCTSSQLYWYDREGRLLGSIELEESRDVPAGLSFSPDGESLLVLYEEGVLERYLLTGQRTNRLDLQTEQDSRSVWQYADDETLILTSSLGSAVLDITEDLFGMRQWVEDSRGWDKEQDQFYVDSLAADNLGVFARYSTEDLIRLGWEQMGWQNPEA